MTAPGRYIPGKQREACFASMLLPEAERNELRARQACAGEVLERFDIHHVEYFAWGGSNRWWNLDPQLRADHKARTKTDISVIAKSKRIRRKRALHQQAMKEISLGYVLTRPAIEKRKLLSRPFPKAKHKFKSFTESKLPKAKRKLRKK